MMPHYEESATVPVEPSPPTPWPTSLRYWVRSEGIVWGVYWAFRSRWVNAVAAAAHAQRLNDWDKDVAETLWEARPLERLSYRERRILELADGSWARCAVARPTLAQKACGVVHVAGACAPTAAHDSAGWGCCMGEVMYGPPGCTCWEPVFDLEQMEPNPSAEPTTRAKCCEDCAYRLGSPERADEYEEDALLDLPNAPDRMFWCHQGVCRAVTYRHPDGREVPADPGDYQPPEIGGRIYRADGTVGERCAGWAALKRSTESAA